MAKRGQSKYMPHLRKPSIRTIGHRDRIGHIPTPDLPTKGKLGGLCNRSACLRPGAWWWNKGSYAYYCPSCSADINAACFYKDYVSHNATLLLTPPMDVDVIDCRILDTSTTHPKPWAIRHGDGTMIYFDTEEEACDAQLEYRDVAGLRDDGLIPQWYEAMDARFQDAKKQLNQMLSQQ